MAGAQQHGLVKGGVFHVVCFGVHADPDGVGAAEIIEVHLDEVAFFL